MTTYVQFTPTTREPFSFQAALDGVSYTLTVRWLMFGQRFYLECAAPDGTIVFYRALIASPTDGDINLAGGYFEVSTLVFRQDTQMFEIAP